MLIDEKVNSESDFHENSIEKICIFLKTEIGVNSEGKWLK